MAELSSLAELSRTNRKQPGADHVPRQRKPAVAPRLRVRCETPSEGVAVCELSGEIDMGTASGLARALAAIDGDTRVNSIVLDLTQVTFLSTTAVETLLVAASKAKLARQEFVAALGTRAVVRAFELTGADRDIPWYTTRADALEASRTWSRCCGTLEHTTVGASK